MGRRKYPAAVRQVRLAVQLADYGARRLFFTMR